MKVNLSFIFLISILLSLSIGSCSKDSGSSSTQTKTEILTSYKWKISSVLLSGVDITTSFILDCDRDNYAVFKTGGVFEDHAGAVKCDPAVDPDVETGTWALSADEKSLTINTETVTIISISTSTIKVQDSSSGFGILDVTYISF